MSDLEKLARMEQAQPDSNNRPNLNVLDMFRSTNWKEIMPKTPERGPSAPFYETIHNEPVRTRDPKDFGPKEKSAPPPPPEERREKERSVKDPEGYQIKYGDQVKPR